MAYAMPFTYLVRKWNGVSRTYLVDDIVVTGTDGTEHDGNVVRPVIRLKPEKTEIGKSEKTFLWSHDHITRLEDKPSKGQGHRTNGSPNHRITDNIRPCNILTEVRTYTL
jgi:hypothetical protein